MGFDMGSSQFCTTGFSTRIVFCCICVHLFINFVLCAHIMLACIVRSMIQFQVNTFQYYYCKSYSLLLIGVTVYVEIANGGYS